MLAWDSEDHIAASPVGKLCQRETRGRPEGWKRTQGHCTSCLPLFLSVPHQPHFTHWKWQSLPVAGDGSSLLFYQLLPDTSPSCTMSLPQRFGVPAPQTLLYPNLETPAAAGLCLFFEFCISPSQSIFSKLPNVINSNLSSLLPVP